MEQPESPGEKSKRVRLVVLLSIGIYLSLMLALGYAWYANQWASAFSFFNDLPEWKQLDKFAHFFWTFQASMLASRMLGWARLDNRQSARWGAFMGFMFVSLIEIPDGFSESYGASVFDILANGLGCTAFLLQRIFWQKIRIMPKYSFHPTAFAPLRPSMLGDGILAQILKDYNGQTFWYSLNIEKIPLPRWLVIAVGVGAEGMLFGRDEQNAAVNLSPYRKFFISFDLNLSHVKTSSKILNAALYTLNIFKFPAPAIEISTNGIRFHPIYF